MYKKILIPLENSPADITIIDHIRGLAKILNSGLILVHVPMDMPPVFKIN